MPRLAQDQADSNERLFLRLDEDRVAGPESATPPGTLRALPVPPTLSPLVAHVLEYREAVATGEQVVERVLPDGATRLVLNLGDVPGAEPGGRGARRAAFTVVGATARPALVHLHGHVHGLSVTLRTGAATALLGVPAHELSDAVVDLADLWGSPAREFAARLADAPDERSRGAVLGDALRQRVRAGARSGAAAVPSTTRSAPVASAALAAAVARHVASRGGVDSLHALAARTGLGERRLQQVFREHVGLSPRTWSRLARLHGCLRLLRSRPAPAWAQVALDAGYFDQSHLVNEFRALCGLTPGAFLARTISRSSKHSPERVA